MKLKAQSVSYAWYANVSVEQIVKLYRWTQHSTFANFYLWEVTGQQAEMLLLPPLMSAGKVINDTEFNQKKKKKQKPSPGPGASL